MAKPLEILLVSLGGTIALELRGDRAKAADTLPALLSGMSIDASSVSLTLNNFAQKDSVDLTVKNLGDLACFISQRSRKYDGIVVTTGTDTLEEVAFFLHLAFGTSLNIVVTGAMRPPFSDEFDGISNLEAAITTCTTHAAAGQGVYVTLSQQVIPAQFVIKKSSYELDGFVPIYPGPWVVEQLSARQLPEDTTRFDTIDVPIFATSVGTVINPDWLANVDGCVISCPGAFSASEEMLEALAPVAQSKPVALVSRCPHNARHPQSPQFMYPGYLQSIEAHGFLIQPFVGLSPHQARLTLIFDLLMTAE